MNITTRVLLVEDEEDAREILSFYLDTVFDEVKVAVDGQNGLDIYKQYHEEDKTFDLVISDIKMPNLNGIEMIERISLENENQKFIIVSAHKDEEYLFKSISLNVISYFVKPLEVTNIMNILKKVKEKVLEDKKLMNKEEVIKINSSYSYDVKKEILYNKDKNIDLSKKETLLLKALLEDIKSIKSKDSLKLSIWNDINSSDATLRTIIKRLKDKISKEDFIVSKKGKGYIVE